MVACGGVIRYFLILTSSFTKVLVVRFLVFQRLRNGFVAYTFLQNLTLLFAITFQTLLQNFSYCAGHFDFVEK